MSDYKVLCAEFRIYDDEKFAHLNDLIFDAMHAGIDGKAQELGYEAVCISREPELTNNEDSAEDYYDDWDE